MFLLSCVIDFRFSKIAYKYADCDKVLHEFARGTLDVHYQIKATNRENISTTTYIFPISVPRHLSNHYCVHIYRQVFLKQSIYAI